MFGFHIIRERWKYNSEFDMYVSSLGRFKDKSKQMIYPAPQYNYLVFFINGKVVMAHRIVLMTFNPIKDKEIYTVDHIDHNTRNNQLSNLRWMLAEQNSRDKAVEDFIEAVKKKGIQEYFIKERANIEKGIFNFPEIKTKTKKSSNEDYGYSYDLTFLRKDKDNVCYHNLSLHNAAEIINIITRNKKCQIRNDLKSFAQAKLESKVKYGFEIKIRYE